VVVQGDLVGVANRPIAANELGALAVAGVYDFAKATGVGTAIAIGATCYWNDAANQATTTAAGNKLLGKCVRAAADADATVRIRMSQ
jgi:predicted RecA/RadA family phage recombinase